MTNEELKARFLEDFAELHAKVDALPDGPQKTRAQRLLDMFHKAGEIFLDHCVDLGEVQPLGLTDKPT